MKSIISINILLILSVTGLIAQNLVPNPSFEEMRDLPIKPNPRNSYMYEPLSGYRPYQKNLNYWFAATSTTPDLRIWTKEEYYDCKKRYQNECEKPRTGIVQVGILTYHQNRETETYREYVQVKLKRPLRPDELTFVEFWVKKERDAKLVSNNLGAYFSMKKVQADILDVIKVTPQFNYTEIMNPEKSEWLHIKGEFMPDKAFSFLTLGNFFDNEVTTIATYPNYSSWESIPPYAYYLIDDVRVWQANDRPDDPLLSDDWRKKKPTLEFKDQKVTSNKPIRLNNILFDYGKATLQASSFAELERLLAFLKENPTITIAIHGHTDNQGSNQYNLDLSTARAKAVFDFLQQRGVDGKRLQFIGFGESRPLADNISEKGQEQNRRVEFVVKE